MSHIFVSYSHYDTAYAHGLAKNLHNIGFDVWIDERLDYGSQWPRELQTRLDTCDAFILIMTPRSFASDWVQSELQRAKRKQKPIFPLLLEGDEPWLSVESTQFYDVRGGGYPDARFYAALRHVAVPGRDAPKRPLPQRSVRVKVAETPRSRFTKELVITLIGAMATVCAAILGLVPAFREWIFPQKPDIAIVLSLTSAVNAAAILIPTTSVPELTSPVSPTYIVSETTIPTNLPTPSQTTTSTSTETLPATETVTPTSLSIPATTAAVDVLTGNVTETIPEDMVLVPEGEFTMGYDGNSQAKPEHLVSLLSFYIDTYEVTNALYKICDATGPCSTPANRIAYDDPQFAAHPVVFVTWREAKVYCEWRGARLPTEAEWEKAARGTDARSYPWGGGIDCSFANFKCTDNNRSGTTKVGSYEAGKSLYGAYDLAGNVSEWVSSLFKSYRYSAYDGREDPNASGNRVLRGGNWNLNENFLWTWYRNEADPKQPLDRVGFRCVKTITP